MARRLLGLLVAGGCFSPSPPAGAPCPTGVCPSGLVCSPATMTCEKTAVDAAIDTPDATPDGCYGGGLLTVCPDMPITGQTQITVSSTTTLDTGTSSSCIDYHLPNGMADKAYCLVAAKTVTITTGGRVNVTGPRPLVLLATNTLSIDGTLDAASHRGGLAGPAADPAACVAGGVPALDDGGPGGSFGTAGGAGGGTGAGAAVAPAPPTATVTTLRGGCPGRAGSGGNAGAGGRGGGAVYLIAQNLSIAGTINVSGASGIGAGLSAGGGGGGSGGMLGLHATTITIGTTTRIFANGGGGGEGGGGSNGGDDGIDSTGPTVAGLGGGGNAGAGGDGGNGAAGGVGATDGATGSDSGGGGGGGAGVILAFPAIPLGGSISPPPR